MQSTLLTNIFNGNQYEIEFDKTVEDPGFSLGAEDVHIRRCNFMAKKVCQKKELGPVWGAVAPSLDSVLKCRK